MSAWQRISRGLTAGRALIGLLVVMNVFLCLMLLRSSRQGQSDRERDRRSVASAESGQARAARRAGQGVEGVRHAAGDDQALEAEAAAQPADPAAQPAERDDDGLAKSDDPEVIYDRLLGLARPSNDEEQLMRAAFDRHYPSAQAAKRAGDAAGAVKAWRAYCDEIAPSFDERRLKKMGCIEAPPPPAKHDALAAPGAARPEPAPTPVALPEKTDAPQ